MLNVKDIIRDLEFNHDIEFPQHYTITNPVDIQRWISLESETDSTIDFSKLIGALEEFNNQNTGISQDEIKEVYKMLKDRIIHPMGIFDKQGRFYLEDAELVDVRSPSAKYPYSQMNAGRTSKFVKAIANKYKCKNIEDMLQYFSKA